MALKNIRVVDNNLNFRPFVPIVVGPFSTRLTGMITELVMSVVDAYVLLYTLMASKYERLIASFHNFYNLRSFSSSKS